MVEVESRSWPIFEMSNVFNDVRRFGSMIFSLELFQPIVFSPPVPITYTKTHLLSSQYFIHPIQTFHYLISLTTYLSTLLPFYLATLLPCYLPTYNTQTQDPSIPATPSSKLPKTNISPYIHSSTPSIYHFRSNSFHTISYVTHPKKTKE